MLYAVLYACWVPKCGCIMMLMCSCVYLFLCHQTSS